MTEDRIKYARKAIIAMPLACDDPLVARDVAMLLKEAVDEVEKLREALTLARMCLQRYR